MGISIQLRTRGLTPDEIVDDLGISKERRDFLRTLAESAKTPKRPSLVPLRKKPERGKAA